MVSFLPRPDSIYEYPSVEYADALANYIAERSQAMNLDRGERLRILEAGAGEGRLSFLLDEALEGIGVECDVLPVDDFSWHTHVKGGGFSIASEQDTIDALADFRPHLAITAWAPGNMFSKWTSAFRDDPGVAEYLFIGIPHEISSELMWADGDTGSKDYYNRTIAEPAYVTDGFVRVDMPDFTDLQLCYTSTKEKIHPSVTIAFRPAE